MCRKHLEGKASKANLFFFGKTRLCSATSYLILLAYYLIYLHSHKHTRGPSTAFFQNSLQRLKTFHRSQEIPKSRSMPCTPRACEAIGGRHSREVPSNRLQKRYKDLKARRALWNFSMTKVCFESQRATWLGKTFWH